jgi:hypothetical protein
MQKKILLINKLSIIILPIYVLFRIIMYVNFDSGAGDENVFINDLRYINNFGWWMAIEKGISIPYMILVYPLSFIFKNYVALRLINFFLFLLLLIYINYRYKNVYIYFYLLFYLFTSGSFFIGTNDGLLHLCLIIFFSEIYLLLKTNNFNFNLTFISLIVAFFTREMILMYIPIIIITILIIFLKYKINITKIYLSLIIFIFFLTFNIPSIIKNNTLSYDKKLPPENVSVNWVQRQYLSQLYVNNGKIKNNQHVTWQEVQEYVNLNGEDSLPKTQFNSIFFNLKQTFFETLKNFFTTNFYFIRQLGFIILINLFFMSFFIIRKKQNISLYYIPLVTILTILLFSIVIFSYVELRWLVPIGVLSIIYYSDLQIKFLDKSKYIYVFLLNYLIFLLMIIYGTYNIILNT